MQMNNRWNRFIYRLWAPVYDATVNRLFAPGRRRALELLAAQPAERLLIVGVGTGADLPFLPNGLQATGIDLSTQMLARAHARLATCRASVALVLGDAQNLPVAAGSCQIAILNLILSVVPDPRTCLEDTLRALKPGGRVVVFDKFRPQGQPASRLRRVLNIFSTLFGTDITRSFEQIAQGLPCIIERDEASLFRGAYRVILLRKI